MKKNGSRVIRGWLRDIPDIRDFDFKLVRKYAPVKSLVDLRSVCSPVEDQGDLGSCTAQALVGALEVIERLSGKKVEDLSRLFLYYNERMIEGTVGFDSGAQLRTGIKALTKYGVCEEALWGYTPSAFTVRPSAVAYKAAQDHQILQYHRLHTLNDMLECLSRGFPFVCGFSVYSSFMDLKAPWIVTLPTGAESNEGGHAILIVGFDLRRGLFICRNSWGSDWADRGYFYMPLEYLSDRQLSDDFWTITMLEGYEYDNRTTTFA